jgi:hypothetical protein
MRTEYDQNLLKYFLNRFSLLVVRLHFPSLFIDILNAATFPSFYSGLTAAPCFPTLGIKLIYLEFAVVVALNFLQNC